METTTHLEFFSAATYHEVQKLVNDFLAKYSSWQLISISHALFNGGVSVACVFKMKGL